MGFGESVKSVFGKYATFSGRARRSEFWWWYLFTVLISIPVMIVFWVLAAAGVAGSVTVVGDDGISRITGYNSTPLIIGGILVLFVALFLLLPTLAVFARRLHDMGQSAGWLFLMLIGLGIVPLIMAFFDSEQGSNKHGADPKAGERVGAPAGYQAQASAPQGYAAPAVQQTPPAAPPAPPAAPPAPPVAEPPAPPAPPAP